MAIAHSSKEPETEACPLVLPTPTMSHSADNRLYAIVVKRCVDVLVASIALLVLTPLLILVALAVRLDSPGPVFFRQTRIGRHNREFTIFKFRTMVDAGPESFQLLKDDDGQWRHKIRHDPRITRIGRLLRRTSVDELPQFLNIVLGHMSLVGPRPELPQIVQRYEQWQHQRHLVRPGLTGWWQVSGRSDRPMHEHIDLDLYYIEHLSIWLDLKIMLRTVKVVLRGLGAF
ncbi:MAG TPA: exopolysaccharide biosynthesis polyprenyl glycosylphosphotransferase [Thermomicrobiales bacterium]|nr:exopolysaccharide biosynthesis polyprenyl glycosylphosphotransferase [Thermomicrobiales bacterium]